MNTITLSAIPADEILDELTMGNLDPIRVKLWMKKVEADLEKMKEIVDEKAFEEAQKHGKVFEMEGYKIESVDYMAPRYDYRATNHPQWLKFKSEEDKAAELRKSVEKQLIAVKEPFEMVDENSGEMVKIYPPAKSGKSGLRITRLNS